MTSLANVNISTDSFDDWVTKTNLLIAAFNSTSNASGVYTNGVVNAASFTTTNVTVNNNGVYVNGSIYVYNSATINASGIFPTSNTVGANLGSITQRFNIYATNVNVSGTLSVNSIYANGSLGTAGQFLTSNGSGTYWSSSAGSVSAAGSPTYVQYNTGGALAASPGMVFISAYNNLYVANNINATSFTTTTSTVNTTGMYTTGVINAAAITIGGINTINSTGVFTSGSVNGTTANISGLATFANVNINNLSVNNLSVTGTSTVTSTTTITSNTLNVVAVYGQSNSAYGVQGVSNTSAGVYGFSTSGNGVKGVSVQTQGIYGQTQNASSAGIIGYAADGTHFGMLGYNNHFSFYGNGDTFANGMVFSNTGFQFPDATSLTSAHGLNYIKQDVVSSPVTIATTGSPNSWVTGWTDTWSDLSGINWLDFDITLDILVTQTNSDVLETEVTSFSTTGVSISGSIHESGTATVSTAGGIGVTGSSYGTSTGSYNTSGGTGTTTISSNPTLSGTIAENSTVTLTAGSVSASGAGATVRLQNDIAMGPGNPELSYRLQKNSGAGWITIFNSGWSLVSSPGELSFNLEKIRIASPTNGDAYQIQYSWRPASATAAANTGTISGTINTDIITGSGTDFAAWLGTRQTLVVGANTYKIAAVLGPTQIQVEDTIVGTFGPSSYTISDVYTNLAATQNRTIVNVTGYR